MRIRKLELSLLSNGNFLFNIAAIVLSYVGFVNDAIFEYYKPL